MSELIEKSQHNGNGAPFYLPIKDEVAVFERAWINRIPVLLKGPTGCGKTRFVEYMAHRIKLHMEKAAKKKAADPLKAGKLYTVSCHEDLTGRDLIGRYIIKGGEAVWVDGPVCRAVKEGAILYLDEVVEARKDVTVIIHPLTDHRRKLPVESLGLELEAPGSFMLVVSYNPGYQSIKKNLKPSTKQRFIALDFSYPPFEKECVIVSHESGVDAALAKKLVTLGNDIRGLTQIDLDEGVSTRSLIYAGKLIASGVAIRRACSIAIAQAVTDEREDIQALEVMIEKVFS